MPGLYGQSGNVTVNSSNTTGLYAIANTGNIITGNVSSVNTTGLYTSGGNVYVPSSAQQLLNLLSNNGTVIFQLDPAYAYQRVEAFATGNGGGGTGNTIVNLVGEVTGLGATGSAIYTTLSNTGVVAATYGNLTYIPQITIAANGRVTAASVVIGYGNANVASYLTNTNITVAGLTTTGNVSAGNVVVATGIFYANGQPFVSSSYGNANVAAYLNTYQSNIGATRTGNISTGNVYANNGNFTGNVRAGNLIITGNTYFSNVNATITTTLLANANVVSTNTTTGTIVSYGGVGVVGDLNVGGNITANLGTLAVGGNITSNSNVLVQGIYTNNYFYANGQPLATSFYSNANVTAYLAANTDPTINAIYANVGTLYLGNIATNANLGAFETYANTQISTINANLGAYQTYANANAASQATSINTINANVGAFQTYANLTFATNANIQTLNANVGAFETYANVTFSTVANAATQQVQINNLVTNANANIAAYLPTYTGQIGTPGGPLTTGIYVRNGIFYDALTVGGSATLYMQGILNMTGGVMTGPLITLGSANYWENRNANINVTNGWFSGNAAGTIANYTGTVTVGNVNSTNGYFWANGTPYANSNYGNTQVAAYLPTDPTIQSIQANVGTLYLGNIATNANLGAFEIYANTTFATSSSLQTLNANVGTLYLGNIATNANLGAYQTYANAAIQTLNANVGTLYLGNIATNANLGAYQTYANAAIQTINANVGTLYLGNIATNANLGAFETYANTTFATSSSLQTLDANVGAFETYANTSIQTINANLGAFETYANVTFSTVANAASQQTQIDTNTTGLATLNANVGAFETYANLTFGSSGYSNVNVAAYLTTATISTTGNVTAANLTTGGNLTASYVKGDGSLLTNLPTQTGTYSNTNVAAYLTGTIAVGNISSTNGYFWANGTAYSTASAFTGNLAGSILYDSVNERWFGNAYPLSTPNATRYQNGFSDFIQTAPVYTNGAVQPPASTGLASRGGTTVGAVRSANIAIQSAYGAGGVKQVVNTFDYMQILGVTANTMNNNDRVRGFLAQLDVNPTGYTWGATGTGSQAATNLAGAGTITQLIGSGTVGHMIGVSGGVNVIPAPNTQANLLYGTGSFSVVTLASNVATCQGNIGYARLFSGVLAGFSSNLTIQNAVGLHTHSGWAGTGLVGAANNPILGRYVVLNEDANTTIQTNGNLVVTGNTKIQALQETVYATGFTGGAWTANVALGTIQTATLTSNITSLAFTNMPPGGTVTLIITQGGSGSYTLTTTGIKYAGASSTLSTAVGAIDMLNILFDGTNYYGSLVKGYA